MAKIREDGWYTVTEDGGYEYLGANAEELADELDSRGELDSVVKDWAVDYYCLDDLIDMILNDECPIPDRDSLLYDWKYAVDDDHEIIYRWEGDIQYFEEGEEVEADFIIDSEGNTIEEEDEDEDEEDEEDE